MIAAQNIVHCKEKRLEREFTRGALKECGCGGGREGGDEGSKNVQRRSTSSPKSSLITVEGEAVITQAGRGAKMPQFLPRRSSPRLS